MPLVEVVPELCRRCFSCAGVCPCAVFYRKEGVETPLVGMSDMCIGCGHCVSICPSGAVSHEDYPPGSVYPVARENLPSFEQVLEIIRARRSKRAFKDKPVDDGAIEGLIEAARYAPSAHNEQTVEFVVVRDREALALIVEHTTRFLEGHIGELEERGEEPSHLPEFRLLVFALRQGLDLILFKAPVFIALHGRADSPFADANSHLALQNVMLAAEASGLGGFYTGFVILACRGGGSIPGILGIPAGNRVHCGIALGHPVFEYGKRPARKNPAVRWV